jgi:hypothetical protein
MLKSPKHFVFYARHSYLCSLFHFVPLTTLTRVAYSAVYITTHSLGRQITTRNFHIYRPFHSGTHISDILFLRILNYGLFHTPVAV